MMIIIIVFMHRDLLCTHFVCYCLQLITMRHKFNLFHTLSHTHTHVPRDELYTLIKKASTSGRALEFKLN